MKRDMDLVRKILFKMQSDEKRSSYGHLKIDGYSEQQVNYHMKIMAQAGLLHVDLMEMPMPTTPSWQTSNAGISYYSISWDGQEFLDVARDNTRWDKAKDAMAQAGGFALDVMKQLLIQYLKAELKLP
jgi:hypothetical protein